MEAISLKINQRLDNLLATITEARRELDALIEKYRQERRQAAPIGVARSCLETTTWQ